MRFLLYLQKFSLHYGSLAYGILYDTEVLFFISFLGDHVYQ